MQGMRCLSSTRCKLSGEDQIRVRDDRINYVSGMWSEEKISNSEGTPFEKKKLRALKSRSRSTEPTIWLGKEGASEALLSQVENQLKSRELIKVKIQRSALREDEANDFATKIAASTGSSLVEVMGHTFTLYKKRVRTATQKSNETSVR